MADEHQTQANNAKGTLCACGRPLHYNDPEVQRQVQALIDILGPDVKVVLENRSWLVPRHYIALHGLKAIDLPGSTFQECEAV